VTDRSLPSPSLAEPVRPEHCADCVLCREHVDLTFQDEDDPSDLSDPGGEPDHDPATCACEDARPCPACRLAAERDALAVKLTVLSRAIAAMIARNGFCVVCERYAPFHTMGCVMGHVNS
jgi:hypothetical protein